MSMKEKAIAIIYEYEGYETRPAKDSDETGSETGCEFLYTDEGEYVFEWDATEIRLYEHAEDDSKRRRLIGTISDVADLRAKIDAENEVHRKEQLKKLVPKKIKSNMDYIRLTLIHAGIVFKNRNGGVFIRGRTNHVFIGPEKKIISFFRTLPGEYQEKLGEFTGDFSDPKNEICKQVLAVVNHFTVDLDKACNKLGMKIVRDD